MKGAEPPGKAPASEREVIEVVAEPLIDGPGADPPGQTARRLRRRLGPVLAGIIIDAVDLSTFNPVLGFTLGALCGVWLAGHLGFRLRQRFAAGLACGVYCMFPPTNFFPLATMLGVWANFRDPG